MKLFRNLSLVTISLAISLSAGDLIKDAIEEGLKAIPQDKKVLQKLIDNPKNRLTPEKIKLGEMLYNDTRLSKGNNISCATCHILNQGGDEDIPTSVGHLGRINPHHINSPTVYNAVFFKHQFWDGRSPSLEDQAKGPIQAPPEMAMTKKEAVDAIKAVKGYYPLFKKAFPKAKEPITFDNITKAIAAFERTLVTPSRFDDFMNGDKNALTQKEKEGFREFLDLGCAACHNGYGVGSGRMEFYKMVYPYTYNNIGNFTGNKNHMVKIPTLRNITETAPYFHNGTIKDLKKAIKIMGYTQLGIDLTKGQIDSIYAFLKTLDGRKPKINYPKLP